MLAEYLRYYRTNHGTATRIGSYGAHAAHTAPTLNNEQSPYNKKKRTHHNTPSKPCLCGDMHYWGQCPYIDETQRQKGFLLDPEKAKKITEFEAKNRGGLLNKIREKNKRYKRHRTQPPDSDSIEIDAGDDPVPHQFHETYAVYSSAFNNPITSGSSYPLSSVWWRLICAAYTVVCSGVSTTVGGAVGSPGCVAGLGSAAAASSS